MGNRDRFVPRHIDTPFDAAKMETAAEQARVAARHLISQGGTASLKFTVCKDRGLVVTSSSDVAVALCDLWAAAVSGKSS